MKSVRLFWFSCLLIVGGMGVAQSNPVPFVSQPLVPAAAAPGSAAFTLTVNGAGFVSGATVNWNGTPLSTTFVSAARLTATVPAADVASQGTARITVENPTPGGGNSDPAIFAVTNPASSLVFRASLLAGVTAPLSAASADFNHDGIADLAVIDQAAAPSCNYQFHGTGSIATYLGSSDGTFTRTSTLCLLDYLGAEPASISLVSDWNRDGNQDLIWVANAQDGSHIAAYYGNGNGTFSGPRELYPFGGAFSARAALTGSPHAIIGIASGDFDGDGKMHIVASEFDSSLFLSSQIFLLPERNVLFSKTTTDYSGSLVAGDFNHDGLLDFALGSMKVFLNSGAGVFTEKPQVAFGTGAQVATGDFNGDGIPDAAAVQGNSIAVLLGNGDGTFTAKTGQPTSAQTNSSLTTADMNGDGKLDLVVVDSTKAVSIWVGKGDGTFQGPIDTTGRGDSVIASDFNGDGKMDLAVTDSTVATTTVLLQGSPYQALVESPIDADGSSEFSTVRFALPVRFTLAENGVPTCTMPAATVAVTRTAGRNAGVVSERNYIAPGDKGSDFRINRGTCQYVYRLNTASMGPGTYRVDIKIKGTIVGDAVFTLRGFRW